MIDKGSVFTIKMPFISEKPKMAQQAESSEIRQKQVRIIENRPTPVSGFKSELSILIVEDDWELRHYLETEFINTFNMEFP